eukprot:3125846-Rhodomonas_salina.2
MSQESFSQPETGEDGIEFEGSFADALRLLSREDLRAVAASDGSISTSGNKEEIAKRVAAKTTLSDVDVENIDLRDLTLAQLMLAAYQRQIPIKESRSGIEASIRASFMAVQGDAPTSQEDYAAYLSTHNLNADGDLATLRARYDLYNLGFYPTNFADMEASKLMALCDLFGIRCDEGLPRSALLDGLRTFQAKLDAGDSPGRESSITEEEAVVLPEESVIVILLEVIRTVPEDAGKIAAMRPYLARASQAICDAFVGANVYNEVTNRWASQPAWEEL